MYSYRHRSKREMERDNSHSGGQSSLTCVTSTSQTDSKEYWRGLRKRQDPSILLSKYGIPDAHQFLSCSAPPRSNILPVPIRYRPSLSHQIYRMWSSLQPTGQSSLSDISINYWKDLPRHLTMGPMEPLQQVARPPRIPYWD